MNLNFDWKKILKEDYKEIIINYDLIIHKLSEFLNKIHNTNRSTLYWETLSTFALMKLFSVIIGYGSVYDLPRPKHTNPVNVTPPWDSRDVYVKLFNKGFSDVLEKYDNENIYLNNIISNGKFDFKNEILFNFSSNILCIDNYLTLDVIKILRKEFRCFPISRFPETTYPYFKIDNKTRKELVDFLMPLKNSQISEKLIKNLFWGMPVCLIEGYRFMQNWADKHSKKYKCVIFSNQYDADTKLLFIMATVKEQGGLLIGRPHGATYGQSKNFLLEYCERKISDYYLTWGWSDSEYGKIEKCIPMPEPKYCLIHKYNYNVKKKCDIIWISNAFYKYPFLLFEGYPAPIQLKEWYRSKNCFLNILPGKIKRNIKYRPFPNACGCIEEEELFTNKFDYNNIINKERLFDYLFSCRIAIIDHLGTTLYETMAINVPILLVWERSLFSFNEKIEKMINDFFDLGIYHENPESFFKKILEIYDDPYKWWNNPDIQKARNIFLYQFCRVSDNHIDEWKEFAHNLRLSCYKKDRSFIDNFAIKQRNK